MEEDNKSDEETTEEEIEEYRSSRFYRILVFYYLFLFLKKYKYTLIKVKKNSTLQFTLNFSPKKVKKYEFELPIMISGIGKLESL